MPEKNQNPQETREAEKTVKTENPEKSEKTEKSAKSKKTKKSAKTDKKSKSNANIGFEKQLWNAACVLWGHIPAAEYRQVIIGLISSAIFPAHTRKNAKSLSKKVTVLKIKTMRTLLKTFLSSLKRLAGLKSRKLLTLLKSA